MKNIDLSFLSTDGGKYRDDQVDWKKKEMIFIQLNERLVLLLFYYLMAFVGYLDNQVKGMTSSSRQQQQQQAALLLD